MTRLGEWIVGIVIILAVGAVLVVLPSREGQPDRALAARVERLEAEVETLRRQVDATDLARWKVEQRLTLIEARVAIVDARTLTLLSVVPVQAIRDRAAQK